MELQLTENAAWVEGNFTQLQALSTDDSVKAIRRRAFGRFSDSQIPTTNKEEWRYTNLTPVAKTSFSIAKQTPPARGLAALLDSKCLPTSELSARFVFLNGKFSRELSLGTKKDLQDKGVEFSVEIAECLNLENADLDNTFVSLNTALLEEVLCLTVKENRQVTKPIEVVYLGFVQDTPTCYFPRLHLNVGQSSSLEVIERHISTGMPANDISSFCSAVTEFNVAENGELHHVFVQDLAPSAGLVGNTSGTIARSARFHSHVIQLGGKLIRNEIHPRFTGTNAECHLNGLSVLSASQHVDNYTVIDHAAPNCFSRENYKGVYDQKSSGVFCGTIIVQQEAQKTNAIQSNKSILLSNTATVDTKPQLKIWADDVKCTHGATVGQLDDDALFYLQSRGIPKETARQMLISAFVKETIEILPGEQLRKQIHELVQDRL
jgi:Fe-S cluster assembly protein SufD